MFFFFFFFFSHFFLIPRESLKNQTSTVFFHKLVIKHSKLFYLKYLFLTTKNKNKTSNLNLLKTMARPIAAAPSGPILLRFLKGVFVYRDLINFFNLWSIISSRTWWSTAHTSRIEARHVRHTTRHTSWHTTGHTTSTHFLKDWHNYTF